ncbi:endonuclease/exonuclease/phosphatase family protein [Candidatus Bipolaricaulota bacterium]
MKKIGLLLVLTLVVGVICGCLPLPDAQSAAISICSFNIQFLGNYRLKDDEALADLLEDFDIAVIQELVAPPVDVVYPDGDTDKADPEAKEFFDAMAARGFDYWLSNEDTGTNETIHQAGTGTEWWVAFYKSDVVQQALDLPHGFLAADRSDHPDYERVPYAFSFRSSDAHADFVLISVHLQPGSGTADAARRKHEIDSVAGWIADSNTSEEDFIILGDMNIQDCDELASFLPLGFQSLNSGCVPTNTNPSSPRPYDQVLFSPSASTEIDQAYGLHVVDLVGVLEESWEGESPYPGNPYDHGTFIQYFSDHNPVYFMLEPLPADDD